jgi:LPS O-antigen subunit length determinant protein (WzzB/FepE family)
VTEASPKYDDEIDLIESFLILWAGKWVIIACTVISLAIAGIYLALVEPKYESRIKIKQNIITPFLESTYLTPASAIDDFIDEFYSQDNFSSWAKESDDKLLTSTRRFSSFGDIKNKQTELIINSGEPQIIDAHFRYLNFINRNLTKIYQVLSKEELFLLKEQAEEIGGYTDEIVELLLNTNRFLKQAEKGELVLNLRNPTKPVKISPKTELILALSFVLGFFVGCAYVLLVNILRKRKLDAAKSTSLDS